MRSSSPDLRSQLFRPATARGGQLHYNPYLSQSASGLIRLAGEAILAREGEHIELNTMLARPSFRILGAYGLPTVARGRGDGDDDDHEMEVEHTQTAEDTAVDGGGPTSPSYPRRAVVQDIRHNKRQVRTTS